MRFSYADAIVEKHLILARDGITQLAVDLIRPRTSERVPAIFFQSPYYNTLGRGYHHETKTPWGPSLGSTPGPSVAFPEWYDEYFVPRGYALVQQDQRGTRNSSGCQVYGGREEGTDAVDVINWIAAQDWSNGNVGMSGGSYDGTIAVEAASMAPPALKAIIPIRSIDRWYDYHFVNGVERTATLGTPASFTELYQTEDFQNSSNDDALYVPDVIVRKACVASLSALVAAQYLPPYQDARSDFWAARDFVKDASKITAATFIIHGLKDDNVIPDNASNLWGALPASTPKKLWWGRMAHDDPANPDLRFPYADRFVEWTHRWFCQFLKERDCGALDASPVSVQSDGGTWWNMRAWPPPGTTDRVFSIGAALTDAPDPVAAVMYNDTIGGVTAESAPLSTDTHIAGEVSIHLAYSLLTGGDTAFHVALEDVGDLTTTLATADARAAYRADLSPRGPSWPTLPIPTPPLIEQDISFPFMPVDIVVPAGHSLRITITSIGTGGQVSLSNASTLSVPVAPSYEAEDASAR